MSAVPKIRPGDTVRHIGKARLGGPGPYRALHRRINSWTIQHVHTGETFDWVGCKALEIVEPAPAARALP